MNINPTVLEKYQHLKGLSIVQIMKEKLLSDFLGKKNAKKRRLLLSHLRYFDRVMTDRKMRRIYNSILPMGWCRKGIYVVDDPEEVKRTIRTRERTIDAHEMVIKMLEIHKMFLEKRKRLLDRKKESEAEQMRLF